ncbi:MAG: SDR family oxidoreductase [Bacillota bacterium]
MKTALIFGGAGEIGSSIKQVLEKVGYEVLISDIKGPTDKDYFIIGDATSELDVKRVISIARDRVKDIDVVVNAQGFYELNKIDKTEPEIWDKLMNINAKSVFLVCKSIIPYMKLRKKGYIVNIASMAGLRGREGQGAYCASKFAVVGLTESLFEELKGTGVRVTAVCPASVNTKFLKDSVRFYGSEAEKILRPNDVARVVAELVTSHPRVLRKVVSLDIELEIDKLHRKKV